MPAFLHNLTVLAPAALFGTLLAFWGQLRGILARFSSIFIVTFEISHQDLSIALIVYLRENFKVGTLAQRRYSAQEDFIRPLDRRGLFGIESIGRRLTFLKGFRPLFTSSDQDERGHQKNLSISFIRGTFDIEQLIIDAIDARNNRVWKSVESTYKRYSVRRFFGRNRDRTSSNDELASKSPSNDDLNGIQPLKWKREEIGPPLKDEPFEHLFYSKEVLSCLDHIQNWMQAEAWYKERGLPWRQGLLFQGPPGNGKTSLARALAQKFDLPIKAFDLPSMDNEELVQYWRQSLDATPCIVLLEDLDRVFDQDKNIRQTSVSNKQAVTMDCLLNCINGIEPSDGILVIVTANDISKLDSALGVPDSSGKSSRPGRLDMSVYFGAPDADCRRGIASKILKGFEEYIPQVVVAGEGESCAQFQFRCARVAETEYWNRLKPKDQRVSLDPWLKRNEIAPPPERDLTDRKTRRKEYIESYAEALSKDSDSVGRNS